jgi:3-oxoacyl-[acyl-carrier-protein] synthase-3
MMIEELINSGKLKSGQKILLMVPESARFSYAFSLLTVC